MKNATFARGLLSPLSARLTTWVSAIIFAYISAANAQNLGLERYVSPNGSAASEGLTPEEPALSIEAAYAAASESLAQAIAAGNPDARATIFIMPGDNIVTGTPRSYPAASSYTCYSLDLTNSVTIQGFGGTRDECVLRANPANPYRRVLTIRTNTVCVSGVTIRDGLTSPVYGSGVYIVDGGTLTNCVIRDNKRRLNDKDGCGVYAVGTIARPAKILDCEIINNEANNWWGCALYISGEVAPGISVLVENCVISNNITRGAQNKANPGVYIKGESAVVRDCLIANNRTENLDTGGTGVHMYGGLVERCVITNNIAPLGNVDGAGVYLEGNNSVLANCLVANNVCTRQGGGIYTQGNCFIINCTITDNASANTPNGGVFISSTGAVFVNNIISGNQKSDVGNAKRNLAGNDSCGKVFDFNCIEPANCFDGWASASALDGSQNIFTAPVFNNPAANDYTLVAGSPGIDEGASIEEIAAAWPNAFTSAVLSSGPFVNADFSRDLAGTTRPIHGSAEHPANFDIGCYEAPDCAQGPLSCAFSVTPNVAEIEIPSSQWTGEVDVANDVEKVPVTFTAMLSGEGTDVYAPGTDDVYVYTWEIFDGAGDAVCEPIVVEGNRTLVRDFSFGRYDVRLSVRNTVENSSASIRQDACLMIYAPCAFANPEGRNIAPYWNWQDGAHYIQDAVAIYGETLPPHADGALRSVFAAPGNYRLKTRYINLSAPIVVKSVGGPEVTSIEAWNAPDPATQSKTVPREHFRISNPNVVIDGFSFVGGNGGDPDPGSGVISAGMITNCIFNGNGSSYDGGPGVLRITGGTVTDCVFTKNTFEDSGARGIVEITGGTLVNCVITNNGYPNTAVNAARSNYGMLYISGSGVVTNCLIANNRQPAQGGGTCIGGAAYLNGGLLANCIITNNFTSSYGGGTLKGSAINIAGGTVRQCLIMGNRAPDGRIETGTRTIYQNGGTIESCTIVGNDSGATTALSITAIGGTLRNTIYFDNGGASQDITITPENCLFEDPLLGADFSPLAASPCIDAGARQPWMIGAQDLGGKKRIVGANPDIGAFERRAPIRLFLLYR